MTHDKQAHDKQAKRVERFTQLHNFERDGKRVQVIEGKERGNKVRDAGHYYVQVKDAPSATQADAKRFQQLLKKLDAMQEVKLPLRQVRRATNVAFRQKFSPDAQDANKDGFVFTQLDTKTQQERAEKYGHDLKLWMQKKSIVVKQ